MASNFDQTMSSSINRTFTGNCPFTIITESKTFYKNLSNAFSENHEKGNNPLRLDSRYFRNQTEIPNHLKRNTFERTMVIYNITDNKVYNLTDLIGERIHEGIRCVYIHVTRDKNILRMKQSHGSRNIVIDGFQTYVIPASRVLSLSFKSFEYTNVISLEVIQKSKPSPFPVGDLAENIPVDKEVWECYRSFTLSPIYDEQQQLVYLASRLVYDADGEPHLAAMTILNHSGKRIFNTLSCPRKMIINYATPHTGITEKQLRGMTDHYEVYKEVVEKLRGRIIVGYKVSLQLDRMIIDPKIVRGIRDLSNTTAIKLPRAQGELWTFNDLSEILNESMPRTWTTMSEASLINRLYKKLSKNWVDVYAPWEEDLLKVPWDIVNWNLSSYQTGNTSDYIIPSRGNQHLPSPPLPSIPETSEVVDMEIPTDEEYESCGNRTPEKWEYEQSEKEITGHSTEVEVIMESETRLEQRVSIRDRTPERWEYEKAAKEITEPPVQIEFSMETEVWLEEVDDEGF